MDISNICRYSELYLENKNEVISTFDSINFLHSLKDELKNKEVCICSLAKLCKCTDILECDCYLENYHTITKYEMEDTSNCLFLYTFDTPDKISYIQKSKGLRCFTLDNEDNEVRIFDLLFGKSKTFIKFFINDKVIMYDILSLSIKDYILELNFNYMNFYEK